MLYMNDHEYDYENDYNKESDDEFDYEHDAESNSARNSKSTTTTVVVPNTPTLGFISQNDGPEFKWYVVQVLTSNENKVLKSVKERVYNHHLEDFFSQVLIPEETVVSNVRGKKRAFKKKFFPGYVLIKMILNDKTWHLVQNTDKVTGFLGTDKNHPVPLSEQEAAYLTGQMHEGPKKGRTTMTFVEGDSVRVIEGPFASFVGTIESVSDKGKVKVQVSIFGRPTPVELDFTQVERV